MELQTRQRKRRPKETIAFAIVAIVAMVVLLPLALVVLVPGRR
jgi:hypothetical protein